MDVDERSEPKAPFFDGGGCLTLFSPLFYRPRRKPFKPDGAFAPVFDEAFESAETLLWFEITPSQALNIEPAGPYLERLIASGTAYAAAGEKAVMPDAAAGEPRLCETALVLPAGLYWFTQIRARLDGDAFVDMAREAQREALWQRARLGTSVYFRTLREDGAPVSQVFRPVLKMLKN